MSRGSPSNFAYFGGGLNTADGPYRLIEPYFYRHKWWGGECRANMNVVSRHRGNVCKRDGCVEFATNGGVTYKDMSVVGNDSTGFAVLSTTGGALFAVNTSGTATSIVASGLSATAKWTFLRLPVIATSGPGYGMNGVDTPRETDGTFAGTGTWVATTGTVPNGTVMEYHATTLWVAGVAASPYSLYWNQIGDPLNWPTANVTKFNPDDGLPITALRSVGANLLVFKERGIWAVYDEQTSANRKFADNVGTRSPGSVVSTPSGCFFLDPAFGVHITDGNSVRRISASIQPTLDAIADADLPDATGAYLNGHYYLTVKVNGVRYVLDYDTELDSWWVQSPAMQAIATWDQGGDELLFGIPAASTTGSIWQLFKPGVLLDAGAVYESYWSGPFHTFGAPNLRKRCNEVHLDGRGTVEVYVANDYAVGTGTFEGFEAFSATGGLFAGAGTFGGVVGIFGGGGDIAETSLFSLGVSRSWSITFRSGAQEAWEIDAYTMLMSPRKD